MGAVFRTGDPRRTRAGALGLVAAVVATLVPFVTPTPAEASVRTNFDAVYSSEENGAITLAGASSMDCPTAASGCTSARAGTATGTSNNNNLYNMAFVDVDSDSSTSNSSTATLSLPTGSTVLYARLVWGGRTVAGTNGVAPTKAVNTAKFKAPGATSYTTYTATTLIQPTALVTTDGGPYQASLDVTSAVKTAGNGVYAVADIGSATGQDRYAGWSLVVAYRNPSLPLRNLRVFEGFADITSATGNNSVDIPVSGFLTPTTGNVNASVGVVAWEGDFGTTGDALRLANTTLSDATRPANNFFDSRISDAGVDQTGRSPGNLNNFGVDIGRIATTNVISNGSTSATINLTSSGDSYYPGVVTSQIDLFTPTFNAVSKTVSNLNGNNPAQPGDTLEYQLTFTNSGGDYADASVVRDVLPANLTYVPNSLVIDTNTGGTTGTRTDTAGDDTGDYTAADRTVRFRVGSGATASTGGSIAPGGSVAARFRATVNRAASGTTIANTPVLDYRARTLNRPYTFSGNDVNTVVRDLADLSAGKTVAAPSQNAGQTVNYTISATNQGPNNATGVVLTDTLPAGTTFESASPPAGGTCTPSGQKVTCSVGAVANGATVSVPVVARINADSAGGVVINSVTVSASTADDVTVNNTATAPVTVTRAADLQIASTLNGPVVPGTEQAVLTTTVTNAGPSTAENVTISVPLPDGVSVVWASSGCTVAAGTMTCVVGTLAPGVSYSVTAVLGVVPSYADPTLSVPSSVSSTTPDTSTGDNSTTATAPVEPLADIQVSNNASTNAPVAGSRLNYTVMVANPGPSDARNVVVTVPVQPGTTIVSATPQSGTCTVGATVSCQLGVVPAGGATTVSLRVAVNPDYAAGPLPSVATATTSTPQDVTDNDSATVTGTVSRVSDLGLTKTAVPAPVVAGAPLAYSLTVTNRGPSDAGAVVVSDPLPAGLTVTGVQSTSGTCTTVGRTVSCALGTVANGGTASVTITADTPGTVPAAGFSNTATVTSASTDPNPGDNTATHLANVTAQADVTVTETTTTPNIQAGQSGRYVVTVANSGPSVAQAVTLNQTIPAGFGIGTIATSTGTCQIVSGQVRCAIGDLASEARATVTIDVNVPSGQALGSVSATGTVASTTPDPTQSNNSASASVAVRAVADLRFSNLQDPGTFMAGDTFSRTFSVMNGGPSDARDTTIVADLPVGVLDLAATVDGTTCAVTGARITCAVGTMAAGQTLSGVVTGRIAASSPPGPRSFSATISSSTPDSAPLNNTVSASTAVTAYAGLSIQQTVTPSPLVAGALATYQIGATNNGPSDATNVVITHTLPAALSAVSASSSLGTCAIAGQVVTCTVDRLPAGSRADVTVVVNVSPTASGTVETNAQVSTDTPSPGGEDQLSTVNTPVVQTADLVLTGTVGQDPVRAGTAQTYNLTVSNAGPSAAANVVLSDTLPDGLVLLPGGVATQSGTCTPTPDNKGVNCTFGTIQPGRSVVVVLTALVPSDTAAGTVLIDTAAVGSPTADPTMANRSVSLPATVSTAADLSVSTTSTSTNAEAGRNITYNVTVANDGPSVARLVTITDPLPAGTSFVSAGAGCSLVGTEVRCAVGDLAQGAIYTQSVTVLVASDYASQTLVNTATASSATADPNTANNNGSITHTVNTSADLTATNTIVSGPLVAGTPVTYRVGATNNGPSLAPQVVLTDRLPAGLTYGSATPSAGGSCVLSAGAVRCTWPSVPLGAAVSADITATLASGTPAGSAFANTVTASSAVPDPNQADNSATASANVGATADLSVVQTLTSGAPVAGGKLTWQAVVRNDGPSSAYGVTTDAPPPAGIRFDSATATAGTCTFDTAAHCAIGTLAAGATATVTVTGTLAPDYTGTSVTNTVTVTSTSTDPNTANNTSSAVSDTSSSADLRLAITSAPDPAVPGSPATWTLTATNAGPSTSRGVVLNADLPAGVTPQPQAGCAITGQRISCPVGDIATNATGTVTVTGRLAPGFAENSLRVTGTVTSGTADPDAGSNTATSSTALSPQADLAVTATPPANPVAGQTATWTVRVADTGPSDAVGTSLTISVPAYVYNARASWPTGSCAVSGAVVTCPLGVIAAGQTTEVSFTGTIDAGYSGPLTLGAEAIAQTNDPVLANNVVDVVGSASTAADLVSTIAGPDAAVPGTQLTWVQSTRNLGPSTATAVVLTNTVPEGLTGVTATTPAGNCTVTGRDISCATGDLQPGATVLLTIAGTLAANVTAPTLTDTGAGTSGVPDPNQANNSGSATTPVTANGNLHVALAVTSGQPVQGAPIEFRIEVSNAGPSDAQAVTVTDNLPTTIGQLTVLTSQGTCAFTGQALGCDLGTVAAGAPPVAITVRGVLANGAGDTVTNSATASSATTELDQSDNTGTVIASATESANLAVTVDVPGSVVAGTPLTYTVTVTNNGPSTARGATLDRVLPAALTGVTTDLPGCTTASCALGDIAPGASVVVKITGTVDPLYQGVELETRMSTGSQAPDPDSRDNSTTSRVQVTRGADLSADLHVDPTPVVPGRSLLYTATIASPGPSAVRGVVTFSPLPDGTEISGPITSDQGTCSVVVRSVVCDLGLIAPGTPITVKIPVTLAPSFAEPTLSNTIDVQASTPDPNPANNSATASAQVSAQADLGVRLDAADQVTPGELTGWTITVTNNGPSDAPAAVVHNLPADVDDISAVSSQGTCQVTGQTLRCDLSTIASGAAVTVTVYGRLSPDITADELTSDVAVESTVPEPDPNQPDNRTDSATSAVVATSDIFVQVNADQDPITPGLPASWTVLVTNAGPSTARDVVLTGLAPAETTGATITAPAGVTCDANLRCVIGTLPTGKEGTVQFTLRADVPPGVTAPVLNASATVTGSNPDPNPGDNTATASTPISATADLRLGITVDPRPIVAGGAVTITATVTNAGPSTAPGTTFTLPVPTGVEDVTVDAPPGVTCDTSISCTVGDVPPGQLRIVVRGRVTPTFTDDSLTLSAAVTSAIADPNPADNTVTTVEQSSVDADLAVTATIDPAAPVAGSPVTVNAKVRANGPSTATGVTFRLPVPAELRDVVVTGPAGVTCDDAAACQIGTMAPGTEVDIVLRGVVAADFTGGSIALTASVDGDTPDNVPGNDTATVTSSVSTSADLSVATVVDPAPLTAGSPVTLTSTIHNTGPSTADQVVFALPIPAGFTGITVTAPAGVTCDNSVRCTAAAIGPNQDVVVVVRGQVAPEFPDGPLTIASNVTSPVADPNPADNTSQVATAVGIASDVRVTLTVDPTPLVAGSPVTATATIRNTGPSTATGVALTLPVPAGLENVVVTAPPGVTCDSTISCVVGTIAPNTDLVITVGGRIAPAFAGPNLSLTAVTTTTSADPNNADNTVTTTTAVGADAGVSVALAVDPAQVTPGTPVIATATVRNAGPSTATGVTLSLPVPAGLIDVVVTAPNGVTCDNTVSCVLGAIAPDTEVVVTVGGALDPAYQGADIAFTASTTSPTPDQNPADDTTTVTSPVGAAADLDAAITVNPTAPVAGQPIEIVADLVNRGPSTATGVTLAVPVPAGVTGVTVDAPAGVTCDATVSCAVGTLAPGASVRITLRGTVAPDVTAPISVTATGSSPTADPTPANNTATATGTTAASADLAFTGVVTPAPLTAGTVATIAAKLVNNGPSTATGITFSVPVPAQITGVTVEAPPGVTCDNAVTCSVASVPPGGTVDVVIRGTVLPTVTGPITVTGSASSPVADPNTADNAFTTTGTVGTAADLNASVGFDPGQVVAGSPIGATVTIRNAGPSTAAGTTVSVPVPAGLIDVVVTAPNGVTCDNTVSCVLGDVAPGADVVIGVRGRVAPDHTGDITLTATAATTATDPSAADNTGTATTQVATSADLRVTSTLDPTALVAGEPFRAVTTIENTGPSTATGTAFTLPIPPGVTGVQVVAPAGVTCDTLITCTVGTVAPGTPVRIEVTGLVDPAYTGGPLTFTSTATSDTPDPTPDANSTTITANVRVAADIRAVVTPTPLSVASGTPVTVTVTARNVGPSTATGVTLSVPVPAGLQGVTVVAPAGVTCDNTVACAIGTLAPDTQVTVEVRGTVAADYTGDQIVFTGTAQATTDDPNPADNTATTPVQVNATADLSATTTVDPGQATAGSPVTVTTTIRNGGPSSAVGTTFTLPVPAGLTGVTVTAPPGVICDSSITCAVGDIDPGTDVVITVRGTVAPDFTGALTIDTAVTSPTPDPDTAGNTSSTTIPVTANADLSAAFTLDPPTLTAGTAFTGTATLRNAGPSTATGVTFTLPVPAGVQDVTVTAPAGVTCDNTISCTAATVAPGQSIAVTVNGRVAADFTGTTLPFTATAGSATPDSTPANNSVTVDAQSGAAAGLTAATVVNPTSLTAGSPVTVRTTIHNDGPSTAAGARYTLPVPAGVTGATVIAPPGVTCDNTVACDLGTIAPGADVVIEVRGTVAPDFAGADLTFTATATTPTPDPDQSDNTSTVVAPVGRSADLGVTVATDPATATAGSPVSLTATVTNAGPSTAGPATFTVSIPAGLTNVQVTAPAGVTCDNTVTCTIDSVAPGAQVVITVGGTIAPDYTGPALSFTSAISSAASDPNNSGNVTTVQIPVTVASEVSFVSITGPSSAVAGTPIEVLATIRNNGPSTAQGVTLTLPIPAGLTGVTVSALARATCDNSAVCDLGDLLPGAEVTATIRGTVDPAFTGPSLTFTGTVASASTDPIPANNAGTVTVGVTVAADLAVTTALDSTTLTAGEPVRHTATIRNNGPSTSSAITVSLPVPAGLTTVAVTAPPGVTCDNTVTCTIPPLAAGQSVDIVVTGTVDPAFTGTDLDFTADVTAASGDPGAADNTASITAQVSQSANLGVTAALDPAALTPGSPAKVTATVRNAGPSTAQGVTFTVPIPAGLTNVTVTAPAGVTCDTTVSCAIGDLAPGASLDFVIDGVLAPNANPGTTTFTVTANSTTPDPDEGNDVVVLNANVTASAGLSVGTTFSPGTLTAGDPFTATTVIGNTGPSTATGVTFTLPIPAGVEGVTVTAPPGITCDNTVSCTIGDVPPGTDITIVVNGRVSPTTTTAPTFVATVASPTPGPNPADRTVTVTPPLFVASDLNVALVLDPTTPTAGTPQSATVTVGNTGPSAATGVVVTIPVPTGLTGAQFTAPAGVTCDAGGNCVIDTLAPGTQVDITVRGTVAPGATGDLTFTATATSSFSDPAPADNTVTVTAPITASADLVTRAAITSGLPTAGRPVAITTSVTNDGPGAATGVTLTVPLPAGLRNVTVTAPPGVTCDNTVVCVIGTLAPGATVTIDIGGDLGADANGPFDIVATTTSATDDPDDTDNSVTATGAVQVVSDLVLAATLGPDPLVAGSAAAITATATNQGPSIARNVTITVPVPDGLQSVVVNAPAGVTCDTTATCVVDTLEPGASVEITVVGTVAADRVEDLATTVTADSDSIDLDTDTNSVALTKPVTAFADLSVVADFEAAQLTAGSEATIRATVRNAGPSTSSKTRFSLGLPGELQNITITAPPGVTCDNTIACDLGDLPPGASLDFVVRGVFDSDVTGDAAVTAQVESATPDPDPSNDSVFVSQDVTSVTDLGVTMNGPAQVTAGEDITWGITVHAGGPSDARNVVLVDTLPKGVTLVAADPSCTLTDRTLRCVLGTVTTDTDRILTITAHVDANYVGGQLDNAVSVTSTTADTDQDNNTAAVASDVARSVDLGIDKTLTPASVTPGGQATFTLDVYNYGPSAATGVLVTDPLMTGLTPATATATKGSCVIDGQLVTCAPGDLDPLETIQITIVVDVAAGFVPDEVSNTATVLSDDPDSDPIDNAASVAGPSAPQADLSVVKTADQANHRPGDTITWLVTTTNNGISTARGVTVTDLLPASVEVTTPPNGCVTRGSALICAIGDINPGASTPLTITGTVRADAAAGPITNSAAVASTTAEQDSDDNSAAVTTQLNASPDLRVTKSVDGGQIVPGTQATWVVTVTNAGDAFARDVVLTDALPAGATLVSSTGATCANTDGVVTCPLDALAPAATVTVRLRAAIAADLDGTAISNSARVTSSTPDANSGDNNSAVSTTLTRQTGLSVTKTTEQTKATVGDTITWVVTIANTGPSAAPSVQVTDLLPEGITLISAVTSQGTYDPATGLWHLDWVGPADQRTLTVTARVDREGPLVNIATLAVQDVLDSADDNSASATTEVSAAETSTETPTPTTETPTTSTNGGTTTTTDDTATDQDLSYTGFPVLRWLSLGLLLTLLGVTLVYQPWRRGRRS
ncbi:DUF11 domain-containing protein [Actinokineospora auranticolor]|uniref:Putative repeat protein (TIGR01451 family) n=1 Tax=Actinokineospora auranticolor TaxID=155976 RepID=A0A2S6GCX8_9PSEU|nr:DUF11 domain-containing protein [Actinokineospora auranticolor]PPK63070.1 putative repeat protein (TIGR01451 family) [Actinokineospora auranticolor]